MERHIQNPKCKNMVAWDSIEPNSSTLNLKQKHREHHIIDKRLQARTGWKVSTMTRVQPKSIPHRPARAGYKMLTHVSLTPPPYKL